MKKAVIFIVSIFITTTPIAQDNMDIVEKGKVLTLGTVSAAGYHHIDFPKKNIIIKRGAIPNFSSLEGVKVIVEEVRSQRDGMTEMVIKRKDGRNFSRFWPTVNTAIEKAFSDGELRMPKAKWEDSIAHNE